MCVDELEDAMIPQVPMPPASAAIGATARPRKTYNSASQRSFTPSSDDSLDHYSGSSLSGSCSHRTCGAYMHGSLSHQRSPGSSRKQPAPAGQGQAVGEKTNGVPQLPAAAACGRPQSPQRNPARPSKTTVLRASPSCQPSQSTDVSGDPCSIQSSPSLAMHMAHGQASQGADVDAACSNQLVTLGSVQRKVDAAMPSTVGGASGIRPAGLVGSQMHTHTTITSPAYDRAACATITTTKRRVAKTRSEVPPALPFVGSPTPSERRSPDSSRSLSLSRAQSTWSPSPSKSHSPRISSYAQAYTDAQATKKRLAASARLRDEAPFPTALELGAADNTCHRSATGRSSSRGQKGSSRRSAAARDCTCAACGQHHRDGAGAGSGYWDLGSGMAAAPRMAGGTKETRGCSQMDSVSIGCCGGNAGGVGGRTRSMLCRGSPGKGRLCRGSPGKGRTGSAGPLQQSVSEWTSECGHSDACGSVWQSTDGVALQGSVWWRPVRAGEPPRRSPNPAAGGCGSSGSCLQALHAHRCDGPERRGLCIGLETLNPSMMERVGGSSGVASPVGGAACGVTAGGGCGGDDGGCGGELDGRRKCVRILEPRRKSLAGVRQDGDVGKMHGGAFGCDPGAALEDV